MPQRVSRSRMSCFKAAKRWRLVSTCGLAPRGPCQNGCSTFALWTPSVKRPGPAARSGRLKGRGVGRERGSAVAGLSKLGIIGVGMIGGGDLEGVEGASTPLFCTGCQWAARDLRRGRRAVQEVLCRRCSWVQCRRWVGISCHFQRSFRCRCAKSHALRVQQCLERGIHRCVMQTKLSYRKYICSRVQSSVSLRHIKKAKQSCLQVRLNVESAGGSVGPFRFPLCVFNMCWTHISPPWGCRECEKGWLGNAARKWLPTCGSCHLAC